MSLGKRYEDKATKTVWECTKANKDKSAFTLSDENHTKRLVVDSKTLSASFNEVDEETEKEKDAKHLKKKKASKKTVSRTDVELKRVTE